MANAGVVGMAEVVTPNVGISGNNNQVAMWSFIWVGAAALFLIFVHMALVGRGMR